MTENDLEVTAYVTVKTTMTVTDVNKDDDQIIEDVIDDTVSGYLKTAPGYLDMSHVSGRPHIDDIMVTDKEEVDN